MFKLLFFFPLAFVFLFTFCGCRSPGDPDQEDLEERVREAPPPEIPEEIERGENEEPILLLYIAEEGRIKEIPFEEYIMGVVAAEMETDWPQAALAAQAIIARTFTLQKIEEKGGVPGRGTHASTDIEEFQAYDASLINDNVREAVKATRGEVAVYQNRFIHGWFHAYAGPETALADEGLAFAGGNPPYIRNVASPGVELIPEGERYWSASFALVEVQSAVHEVTDTDPGDVTSVEIIEKGPSGRATIFKVNDLEVSAPPPLRLALGSTKMCSTLLSDIKIEGEEVVFSGTGYGHGVGMCQWGAKVLAERSWSPEKIIYYFFYSIEIVKMW